MVRITLPDNSVKEFAATTTGAEIAASIGAGLAKAAVAIEVNGVAQDLSEPITADAAIKIATAKDALGLDTLRHTLAAQVLALAVKELYPDAKLAIGPTIENGCYYDIEFAENISSEDLPKIEARMREIIFSGRGVVRELWDPAKLKAHFAATGDTYKGLLIDGAVEKGELIDGKVSAYRQVGSSMKGSEFVDLCRGPHAPSLDKITLAFSLSSLAGAYWKGDSQNQQLTRIYCLAFATQKELDAYLHMKVEAEKRDHRKLGKELDLFTFSDAVGVGLPLWLPAGTVLRQEIERLGVEEEDKEGYVRVHTPILAKDALYYQSGHLPYYAEDMYAPIIIDEETYYLRPMNCPHHHHIYLHKPKSYRELPYRVAEFGSVFRYEAHGALSGLMRARGFTQNDAHIYCREDQAKDEFLAVMRLHARYYDMLGLKDYYMRLSMPDLAKLDKYVDQPEDWLKALRIMEEAMKESGLPYTSAKGEAAFYGPKVDFQIKSVTGQEYTVSTNQMDFLATQRFNLRYQGEDGQEHPLYVIHRAPLGSHERFVAFLIEHFEGKFPTWLAPMQAVIIPITDDQEGYARQVERALRGSGIRTATGGVRVEVDASNDRMQKKILFAQQRKVPYMLVVGKKEAEDGTVAVRLRDGTDLGAKPLDWLIVRLRGEIEGRKDTTA